MKLVLAILQDRDADLTLERLTAQHIGVTRVATSGGFLRQGSTTLLMGVEDAQISTIEAVLKETCQRRKMFMPIAAGITDPAYGLHNQIEVEVGGATMFVFDIDQFDQV
jgi:uncharacterized protein YaaQ